MALSEVMILFTNEKCLHISIKQTKTKILYDLTLITLCFIKNVILDDHTSTNNNAQYHLMIKLIQVTYDLDV